MIELNKNYFSSISTQVNQLSYYQDELNDYNLIHFENVSDTAAYSRVKSALLTDGFSILQINETYVDNLEMVEKICSSLFGAPLCDKNPGKLPYAKVQREDNAKYYVNSHFAQPMHTDEGYTTSFPRFVALYCAKSAKSGGDSIVVRLDSLYLQLIQLFGESVNLLFKKDAVTVETALGVEVKPILFWLDDGSVGISYSATLHKMWCSEEVFKLFDYITKYAHSRYNQLRIKLKPGQILLFDNSKILHGRSAFTRDDSRLLYRYWFKDTKL